MRANAGEATMSDFKTSYGELLATLYWDIEALLDEYGARVDDLPPAECDALWRKFAGLRARLTSLKEDAADLLAGPRSNGQAAMARMFLGEIERLLDVEHDGTDWETYVGAAMIHAEQRICDEALWVSRWG